MSIAVCWRLLIINLFTVLGNHCWAYIVCVCVDVWHHLSEWIKKEKETNKMHKKEKEKTREQRPVMKYGALVSLWSSSALAMPFYIKSKEAKDFINKFSFPLLGSTKENCAMLRPWVGRPWLCGYSRSGRYTAVSKSPPPTKMVKSPFSLFFSPRFFSPS